MRVDSITPILNVSDLQASLDWFEALGWRTGFVWGEPDPGFASVVCGDPKGRGEIFLCQGGQGGRGRSASRMTFGPDGDQTGDKGVWMSLWVEDVDAVHRECVARGLEITFPPTDMTWSVREMHLRHPDGHVFRIGHRLEEEEEAE